MGRKAENKNKPTELCVRLGKIVFYFSYHDIFGFGVRFFFLVLNPQRVYDAHI